MKTLSDKILIEACKNAIKLNLDPDFILLLLKECQRRNLPISHHLNGKDRQVIDKTWNEKEGDSTYGRF
ncbi:sporulation histidine kinase inhibitor Sda [Shouchella clausii]|uniref:Sporulation histidine kinase inhibitor Sda n=1 Tax=Shouchella clausii TaxID=79880 RepID=A0A268NTN5_SHOCL|nr:sporulation histidine kinase inhibitor Sda [Shouchella clausii]